MSARSPTSLNAKADKAPRDLKKALNPAIIKRARKLAADYSVVLEPHDRLGYVGRGVEMPTVFADGKTEARCLSAMREALTAAIATMLASRQMPPSPSRQQRREAQVNVRLTADERLLLEETARRNHFRGLSDFMRAAALARAARTS